MQLTNRNNKHKDIFMLSIKKNRVEEIINNSKSKKIAVIGDVMLDRYFWGKVSRVSPEAPVPVIDVEKESFHLGGAANVANNLHSLGVDPILCGVVGDDNTGNIFKSIAQSKGININGIFVDKTRPTTVKTRIIGNNQHIARLDREIRTLVNSKVEDFIISNLKNVDELSGIVFEDYNKGTVTESLINKVIDLSKSLDIPIFVDPKFDNFFNFKDVFLLKPNKKEAQNALGIYIENKDDVIEAGKKLLDMLNCQNVLLTLGSQGMMLFESDGTISSVPTIARQVADVSGAGDTAIASLSVSISGGANIKEAAAISNYASGAVCELPGIVSITKEMVFKAIDNNNI
jgi:D-glycero-beta-D-manno-heptose-7-phosphate kinase